MTKIVTFNADDFKLLYPEFEKNNDKQLNYYFAQAEQIIDNTVSSSIPFTKRQILLDLLTCHIASLNNRGSNVVGSLASAGEGSVNVSYSVPTIPNASWYSQSQCGLQFWQMTGFLRLPFYVTGRK